MSTVEEVVIGDAASGLPLVVQSASKSVRLGRWCVRNRERIEELFQASHALLFRNFGTDADEFASFVRQVANPMPYVYRSTPRTEKGALLYTATEYPKNRRIPFHSENSYQAQWPLRLFMFCERAAPQGGETPIAPLRDVTAALSASTRQRFADRGVMYVRNYRKGLDLSWQEVFQTQSRLDVERFCSDQGIECLWRNDGSLRTRQVRPALARHPTLGIPVWFNQAHLFHVSALDDATRKALLSIMSEDELPRHAYYGDGSALEVEALEEIRHAFDAHSRVFRWANGDVLMIDNMAVAHARAPYTGDRSVLVMMCNPYQAEQSAVG